MLKIFFQKPQSQHMIQNPSRGRMKVLGIGITLMSLLGLGTLQNKPLLAQDIEQFPATPTQEAPQNTFRPFQDPFSPQPSQHLESLSAEEIEKGKAYLQKLPQQETPTPLPSHPLKEEIKPQSPRQNRKIRALELPETRVLEHQLKKDQKETQGLIKDMPVFSTKKLDGFDVRRSPFEDYLREAPPLAEPVLEAFGYNLFQNTPERFTPLAHFPVSADYLLGPGDEVRITVWGKIDGDFSKVLDREGQIILPQIGTLHLAGLTFSDAKDFIQKSFARFYKAKEVKINISMGQLRSIRIFVVGKATRPGSYMLSSFSTLVNALFAAGGPGLIGSMRDIQIKRAGKTLTHFDLYDLLLKGEQTGDLPLISGDVIFIPSVGPRVSISGNVIAPARYEIKDPTHLRDLIIMAGGIRADGDSQRLQIERKFEGDSKIVLDVQLKTLHTQAPTLLRDGDHIRVFSINPQIKNTVTVKGNVARPGIFEWVHGMRIRDLFQGSKDFLPETFLDYALIERLIPPDDHKTYLSVSLKEALFEGNDKKNILLHPQDKLVVFQRWDLMEKRKVHLSGAVNRPGDYEYRPKMRLSDLFKLAGGLERPAHPDSYLPEGMIIRKMPPDFQEEKMTFDFKKAIIEETKDADLRLHARDEVYVFDQWSLSQEKTVRIVGAVNAPGIYAWAKNMRIQDLLRLAGGAKYYAFVETAELTRLSPSSDGPKIERIAIDLKKAIAGDEDANIPLQGDDYLSIRAVPEWERYRTVQIKGEVRFPGTYTTQKGERLSSLLERAGGLTQNAYAKGAIFTRKSVQILQQRQLDDAIDRLEQQLLSRSASTIEAALTPEAAMQHKASMGQRDALMAKMRAAKAKGRMSIQLGPIQQFKGSPSDLVLDEGDVLIVPEQPQQVQVLGAVFNQTAFIFDKKTTVAKYLDKAGGLTEDANEDALYILKVDGTAYSKRQNEGFWFWKKALKSSVLDPGDTIVVPEQMDKIFWLREVKDMTQILYQMAVTAGVLIVAF